MKERASIIVRGAVQGVGFRPFVFRLATDLGLAGWTRNASEGLHIEVEGEPEVLSQFRSRLEKETPPRAMIQHLECSFRETAGYVRFEILPSNAAQEKSTLISPDIAVCADCLKDTFDPQNRRYLYPFTNCTNCGPRFSIISSLPYDRGNTSMKVFEMCPDCQREYHDPRDRRFHAQPNACAKCGPVLELWNEQGRGESKGLRALKAAAHAVRAGKILALKGIGGFQLVVDARNEAAVRLLRQRKHRDEKPFALMYPSIELVHRDCLLSDLEARVLLSPAAPIVLLERKNKSSETDSVSAAVAPGNPYLGIMVPYSPLHHLLMRELGFPIVATSGNRGDE